MLAIELVDRLAQKAALIGAKAECARIARKHLSRRRARWRRTWRRLHLHLLRRRLLLQMRRRRWVGMALRLRRLWWEAIALLL